MSYNKLRKLKQRKSGTNVHNLSECPQQLNGKYLHYRPKNAYEGKEIVHILNNECNKKILIPHSEPIEPPAIWSESKFRRFKNLAHRMTIEEKNRLDLEVQEAKLKLKNESDERSRMMSTGKLHQYAKPGTKLYGEAAEADKRNRHILQRAFELRQEQEDEVKHANSIILAAKCLSIRDAQLIEKRLIDKELKEQDFKLDMMMEQERQKGLQAEENRKKKRRELNLRHVNEVSQQIRDNEVQRNVEFEHKQEESSNISKALIAMQRDELKKIDEKRKQQQIVKEEFYKANEAIVQYKIVQKEEERIANLRIQEYMRKKAEREAAYDAEMERIKHEKNLEIARIQAQQQRSMDVQALNDELNAQRIQEEYERIWREKERANAIKRKKDLEDLLKEREKQVEDIKKSQALEIERDRTEFNHIAAVQRELFEIELEKKRKRKRANMKHCKELLQQINEKELNRIELQRQKFEEGNIILIEKELRDLNIKSVLKKKLVDLRKNNVPDQIVGDIQRQLKLK